MDRLLAVEPSRGRVTVFSIDGREVVAEAAFPAGEMGPVTADMVFVDEIAHTCWVRRVEVDTSNGSSTGRVAAGRGGHRPVLVRVRPSEPNLRDQNGCG